MGIRDWLKKPEPVRTVSFAEEEAKAEAKLAEEYSESFEKDIDLAIDLLQEEEVPLEVEHVENPREEYDVGDVKLDDLLDEDMTSNYEVNVVEVKDVEGIENLLEKAEIIGDVSEEVDF